MSGTAYEIPIDAGNQTFSVAMNDVTYNMQLLWNKINAAWTLDIYDENDTAIVTGIPLVTGADLLEQYEYLGIGVKLFCRTDDDADAVPTFDNLGDASHLYFIVEDDD